MFLLLVLLFPSTAAAPAPPVFCFLPPHSSVPALRPMSLSQSPVFYEPRSDSPPSSTPSCTACTWGPPFPRSGLALRSSHTPDAQGNRFSSRPFCVFIFRSKYTLKLPTYSLLYTRTINARPYYRPTVRNRISQGHYHSILKSNFKSLAFLPIIIRHESTLTVKISTRTDILDNFNHFPLICTCASTGTKSIRPNHRRKRKIVIKK